MFMGERSHLVLISLSLLLAGSSLSLAEEGSFSEATIPSLLPARPMMPPASRKPVTFRLYGVLKDSTGNPVSGRLRMTFAVYARAKGGEPLWEENQDVEVDAEGRYHAVLGTIFADGQHAHLFTASPATAAQAEGLWAGVRLEGSNELVPRTKLTVVQPPAGAIPANFFGMHVVDPYHASHWPKPIRALGKGAGVYWPYIEQTKGSYDWSKLDQYVSQAQSHGVSFYYSYVWVPPWAAKYPSTCSPDPYQPNIKKCTSMVANISDFDTFVKTLVTRYKGKIRMYELWNEPDIPLQFTGTVADLVTLTTHEYNDIRAIDPKALIASPSAVNYYAYMDSYWSSGGVKSMDIIAIHGYPNVKLNDVPESIGGVKTTTVRLLMTKYGLTQPIWDTEASWGSDPYAIQDANLRAAFVARHFILHWNYDVPRYYWYAWDNSQWGTLWDPHLGLLRPGVAYQTVYSWLVGATMSTSCSLHGGTLYNATYSCNLTLSGGASAQVVWNTNGSTTYQAPSQYTKYSDLFGNTYTIPNNHVVNIGQQPHLLH